MSDDEHYSLVLPFDTDQPEFARGVEAGCLWQLLRHGDYGEHTIHTANAEMAIRMAEALGLSVVSEEHDDVWMTVTFEEAE